MRSKIAKYGLPKTEGALDTQANSLLTYASSHIEGSSADWTDIPTMSWTAFKDAHAAWVTAYAMCKGAHLPKDTEAKNIAEKALRASMTDLLERGLLLPPRTTEDAVAMGFRLIDGSPTSIKVVSEAVDLDRIVNGAIPGSHTHIVYYHIEGRSNRAKSPYHLAVFQVYIKGSDDPAPILNSETGWSKDYICMREPFEMRHDPSNVGKIAYYRAHWETSSGIKGPWSMASAEIP